MVVKHFEGVRAANDRVVALIDQMELPNRYRGTPDQLLILL